MKATHLRTRWPPALCFRSQWSVVYLDHIMVQVSGLCLFSLLSLSLLFIIITVAAAPTLLSHHLFDYYSYNCVPVYNCFVTNKSCCGRGWFGLCGVVSWLCMFSLEKKNVPGSSYTCNSAKAVSITKIKLWYRILIL